jgi:uncharacterized protein YjbI with pentapeptide repeats
MKEVLQYLDIAENALRGADFSFALLEGADLRGADTRRASFEFADLREAQIDLALLREAVYSGADLRGTQVYRGDHHVATLAGNGGFTVPGGPAGDYILLESTSGWLVAIGATTLITLDELEARASASNSSANDRRASAVIAAYIAAR